MELKKKVIKYRDEKIGLKEDKKERIEKLLFEIEVKMNEKELRNNINERKYLKLLRNLNGYGENEIEIILENESFASLISMAQGQGYGIREKSPIQGSSCEFGGLSEENENKRGNKSGSGSESVLIVSQESDPTKNKGISLKDLKLEHLKQEIVSRLNTMKDKMVLFFVWYSFFFWLVFIFFLCVCFFFSQDTAEKILVIGYLVWNCNDGFEDYTMEQKPEIVARFEMLPFATEEMKKCLILLNDVEINAALDVVEVMKFNKRFVADYYENLYRLRSDIKDSFEKGEMLNKGGIEKGLKIFGVKIEEIDEIVGNEKKEEMDRFLDSLDGSGSSSSSSESEMESEKEKGKGKRKSLFWF